MNQQLTLLGGLGLGAGLMYLFDPNRGRRRRALLLDKVNSLLRETEHAASMTARDVSHRYSGMLAEGKSFLAGGEGDSDRVVAERVRSHIGRVVSHPRSIEVAVRGGRVTLSGPILAHEVDDLLACAASVRGVTGVENRLEVHKQAGNISGLQGGVGRPGERLDLMQANWSPTTQLLAGAAGCALFTAGLTQRFPVACVLGTAGLGLLARATTNRELSRLLGVGGSRRQPQGAGTAAPEPVAP